MARPKKTPTPPEPGSTKEQLQALNAELSEQNHALRTQLNRERYRSTEELFLFTVMFDCVVNHVEQAQVPDPEHASFNCRTITATRPKCEYFVKSYQVLAANPGEALNAVGVAFKRHLMDTVTERGLKVTDARTIINSHVTAAEDYAGAVDAYGDVGPATRPARD